MSERGVAGGNKGGWQIAGGRAGGGRVGSGRGAGADGGRRAAGGGGGWRRWAGGAGRGWAPEPHSHTDLSIVFSVRIVRAPKPCGPAEGRVTPPSRATCDGCGGGGRQPPPPPPSAHCALAGAPRGEAATHSSMLQPVLSAHRAPLSMSVLGWRSSGLRPYPSSTRVHSFPTFSSAPCGKLVQSLPAV